MDPQMRLVIGFDIGTAYSSVSFILTAQSPDHAANKISTEDLEVVMFNGRKQISSELAWCDSLSRWAWGSDIDELVDRGNLQEKSRIKMLKLCLEGSEPTRRARNRVKLQIKMLPGAAKQQLMEPDSPEPCHLLGMYLKLLWQETKAQIKCHYAEPSSGDIFDRCVVESWVSVPKLWSPQINAVIVRVADWAGLPTINLVHEPEAAAALCLIKPSEQANKYGLRAAACLQGIHLSVT